MRSLVVCCVSLICSTSTLGLDILSGDYSKNDPAYVRVMTFNVAQHLGDPFEPTTPWTQSQIGAPLSAINLIIEALDPDVLLLQEVGDIDNGIPYSTAQTALLNWRNANRPGFSVWLSPDGGSIHNAILSRWPFVDINGDGLATNIDIPVLLPGPGGDWPVGGDGGIRGWTQAEINLPDAAYAGDLYVGCSHFRAGSGFDVQRIRAAKNIAAYILYGLNLGSDPLGLFPVGTLPSQPLESTTPIVWGGDFNSVEGLTPVNILQSNNPAVTDDGTDRDGGASWRSDGAAAFDGTTWTWSSTSRLDWMYVQDSLAQVDAAFIFDTTRMPTNQLTLQITQGAPPNAVGLFENARISAIASDHRPVVVDVIMPAPVVLESVSITGLTTVNSGGFAQYQGLAHFSDGSQQTVTTQGQWSVAGQAQITSTGLLTANSVAFDSPATVSFSYSFESVTEEADANVTILSICDRADVNGDGLINGADVESFVDVFLGLETNAHTICRANIDNNDSINEIDLTEFVVVLLSKPTDRGSRKSTAEQALRGGE